MKTSSFFIADRLIGHGCPPYVIAEMSGNHNGDINRAIALIHAAKNAGADAVKLQTYTADTLTINDSSPDFTIAGGLWKGKTLYELYEEAHTPWEWHERLFAEGKKIGITIFSSPFDHTAVDFLESLDAPAYKIASFEAVDLALIEKVALTGKPIILSTGLCNETEINEAVQTARNAGCVKLILLHCVSSYPALPEDMNLATIPDMAKRFSLLTGLSDHTLDTIISISGVSLGACVVEKHFTLSREDGGPDAAFSLEPEELKQLTHACKTAYAALGQAKYIPSKSEKNNYIFRRSLYVVEDMKTGDIFSHKNLRSIRPGYGIPPKHLSSTLGRRATRDISRGTALTSDMISTTP